MSNLNSAELAEIRKNVADLRANARVYHRKATSATALVKQFSEEWKKEKSDFRKRILAKGAKKASIISANAARVVRQDAETLYGYVRKFEKNEELQMEICEIHEEVRCCEYSALYAAQVAREYLSWIKIYATQG